MLGWGPVAGVWWGQGLFGTGQIVLLWGQASEIVNKVPSSLAASGSGQKTEAAICSPHLQPLKSQSQALGVEKWTLPQSSLAD